MIRFVVTACVALSFGNVANSQEPNISGNWSGYWISDTNGHRGPLRATISQQSDDAYRVKFSGRFAAVIPFRYTTTMNVVGHTEGATILAAEKRLGPMGTFRTTATVTATDFQATFNSRRDNGRFVMSRR